MSWPTNKAKRKHMIRVPMTDAEAAVLKARAEEMGIPIARLVRRCVFGLLYEVQNQINPGEMTEPTIQLNECAVEVSPKKKSKR